MFRRRRFSFVLPPSRYRISRERHFSFYLFTQTKAFLFKNGQVLRVEEGGLRFLLFPHDHLFFFFFCPTLFRRLGNIKNTEPLDSKRQHVHTFWVTAFDCGKNRAQADAQVVVTVKPSCRPGWMGNSLLRSLLRHFQLWITSPWVGIDVGWLAM